MGQRLPVNSGDYLQSLRAHISDTKLFNAHEILSDVDEIVLFGSRAAGLQRSDSDLDILCFGPRQWRIKTATLDFSCFSFSQRESDHWLGSELAAHVKTYGVWLLGSNDWTCGSRISLRAVARKERRLNLLIANARANWDKLHPLFRIKNQKTIRRELQRLCLLREGKTVPPTALLDRAWEEKHSPLISPDSAVSNIFAGMSLESAVEAVYPTLALVPHVRPSFGLTWSVPPPVKVRFSK